MKFEVMFPENVTMSLPDGSFIFFPKDQYVYYKPKWSTTFPMAEFMEYAIQKKVVIKDINLDIWDTGTMDYDKAKETITKMMAWVARFSL